MSEDRTLEDFLEGRAGGSADDGVAGSGEHDGEGGSEADRGDGDDDGAGDDDAADRVQADDDLPGPHPDDVPRAQATYDWAPGANPCAACGSMVDLRWRAGEETASGPDAAVTADEMVCADCKAW